MIRLSPLATSYISSRSEVFLYGLWTDGYWQIAFWQVWAGTFATDSVYPGKEISSDMLAGELSDYSDLKIEVGCFLKNRLLNQWFQ